MSGHYVATNHLCLFKFKSLTLKSWFINHAGHISGAQKLNVATNYHVGWDRHRPFPSSQEIF